MPAKKIRKPAYQLHKASGQARVRIDGKDYYLGPYGSQESHDEYDELISAWLSKQDVSRVKLTIIENMKTSTSQHHRQGTDRADRHGSESVPTGEPIPSRPVSERAQGHFDRLVDLLKPQNLCSELDGYALTKLAETETLYDQAQEEIDKGNLIAISAKNLPYQHPVVGVRNKAAAEAVKLYRRFGMTPVDRTGIDCGPDAEEDAFDALLKRSMK